VAVALCRLPLTPLEPAQGLGSEAILNLRLFNQMNNNKHSTSVVYSEYDLEIVFWLHFAKLLGACTGLLLFNAARTFLHCLLFTNKGHACTCLLEELLNKNLSCRHNGGPV